MIIALLVGLTVGFVLSLPPGPISVAVMRNALDGHFRPGLMIGLGAATMDTLYSLVAIFASSAIVETARTVISQNHWLLLILQLLAVATMVILGFKYIRPTPKSIASTKVKEAKQETKAAAMGARRPYVVGIFMSIVNLPSPTFLPSLIAIATFLHANNWVDSSLSQSALYAVGFGSGAGLWFSLLLRTLYTWRKKISPNFVTRLYTVTGASFFLFALILIYNVITTTEWSSLGGG